MDLISWERVWARYSRTWVLKDISMGVQAGEVLAVMGAAGAGKSTLLRTGSGGLTAGAGRCWVNGRDVARVRSAILGAEERIPESLSVERLVERRVRAAGVGGRPVGIRVKSALQAWDLLPARGTRVRVLSSTMRKRSLLAAQWACPGIVWLLDDPTCGLEPAWREAVPALLAEWLKREGGAVVLATHDAEIAANATRVAILSRGRLAAMGTPEALCTACAPEEIVMRTVNADQAANALSEGLHLEAERLPDGLRVRVRHAEQALPGILQTAGASIETVWVRRPTLRDAVAHYSAMPKPADAPDRPPRG